MWSAGIQRQNYVGGNQSQVSYRVRGVIAVVVALTGSTLNGYFYRAVHVGIFPCTQRGGVLMFQTKRLKWRGLNYRVP